MTGKLWIVLGVLVAVAASTRCHHDSNTITGPMATATPAPPGMATPTPAPPGGGQMASVNVGQGGLNFVDQQSGTSTTTIRVGDTVRWTWVGGDHSVTSGACCTGDGRFNDGPTSQTGHTFSRTFTSAGNVPYFCVVHGNAMTGMVVVNP